MFTKEEPNDLSEESSDTAYAHPVTPVEPIGFANRLDREHPRVMILRYLH
jgi:hypothetical protein